MKVVYVNLVMLLIGPPMLLLTLIVFLLMRLGMFVVPKSWKLSNDECWAVNNWVDKKGYILWHSM